ncbi:MAG: PilZ domain-containing protein [Deltaproteobacteria bacterium]|nr:PilZ domain-containing protein [Deltaproteobacteria bacterium]
MAPERNHARLILKEEVQFHHPHHFVGKSLDIGEGGMGVEVPEELKVGQSVEIEVFQGKVTALGTVRWVVPHENVFRVGIQFKEDDWAVMQLVQQWVDEKPI